MMFKPHDYQKFAIEKVIDRPAVGLFLDMGLGKTAITLTAINDLKYNRFAINKVLVVAPKKVAQATWQKEAQQWDHLKLIRFSTCLGSQTKRVRALNTPADIYVINRENIPWLVEYYRNNWPFDMVVLDESSSFKNHQAKRFKAMRMVRPHIKRIVELTGTPAPNGLMDLWAQVYLLDQGERLGKRITGFRERYFEPDQRGRDKVYSYKPKDGGDNAVQKLIGDICVSMKADDYLQLPDLISDQIPVILDPKAKRAYEKLEQDMILKIDESTIDAGSAAVLGNKLLQLCDGAVYDGERNIVEIHNCKIDAFTELIEGLARKPALVFYNYQHDKARILKALKDSMLRVRELKTEQDQQDWNDHKIDILLAHPASAAYGLNLQYGGNHVIWFSLPWGLELFQQANKRLHRQGQTQKVIMHMLTVSGGMDEDVVARLTDKASTQDELIESLKARIKRVKQEVTG
ncbi:SNF2-related protein [Sporolactobacillus kofuensis]|uniref:SNF2-related protein n=1 Tax=Sporolactobacillus kofuensis TaxID=269672 RepID=A0ABW1WA72_9BACL|nr:DEAD/DEAH box helicase [Sporolactobacillus kofuensis]MCO7175546.1 DEAD/DEAH box helicase [Sporolactobacillus kofuensis]